MKIEQKIRNIIKDADIGELKSITWLGSGYVSHAYQIDTNLGSYVLLNQKGNDVDEYEFPRHYATLKCLEEVGYKHAPRPVYLSKDRENLIMSKVDGVTAKDLTFLSESNQKQVAINIVDALFELKVVTYKSFAEAFKKLNIKLPEVSDEESDYQKYVLDSFYQYADSAPADAHGRWLENIITNFKPKLFKGDQKLFWHGDPSGANILVNKDLSINFIDWALSRFNWTSENRNDFSLSYLSNHVPVVNKFEAEIIKYTAHKHGLNVKDLSALVLERRKLIKIADICWAFKMYALAQKEADQDSSVTYKKILDERIKSFKANFK